MLMELSLFPLDKGESLGTYVAKSIEIIEKSKLPFHLHAMGTLIEGEWDQLLQVAKQCFEEMRKGSHRIEISIKIDYREGHQTLLKEKVDSIENKLHHKLK